MLNTGIIRVPINWLMVALIVTMGSFLFHYVMAWKHGLSHDGTKTHASNLT